MPICHRSCGTVTLIASSSLSRIAPIPFTQAFQQAEEVAGVVLDVPMIRAEV